MPKYSFYRDAKCQVWERLHFRIEAACEEEATQKLQDLHDMGFNIDNVDHYQTEILYETSEEMSIEANNQLPTVEYYDSSEKLLFTNAF